MSLLRWLAGKILSMRDFRFKFWIGPYLCYLHTKKWKTKGRQISESVDPICRWDELSGLGIIKFLIPTHLTLYHEGKVWKKQIILEEGNDSNTVIVLDQNRIVPILSIRSLSYYEMQQGLLWQRLSKHYNFETSARIFRIL